MISDIHKIEKLINSQLSSKIYESSIQNDELIILINENDLHLVRRAVEERNKIARRFKEEKNGINRT